MDSVLLPGVSLGPDPSPVQGSVPQQHMVPGMQHNEDVEGTEGSTPPRKGFLGTHGDAAWCPGSGVCPAGFAVESMV